jgi:riboflavin-specific deaminase-like protein
MVAITTLSELTIDGKLSLGANASSKGLFDFYGDELRTWFHAQRAAHDAIMVGAGTVVADDPELTVRHSPGPNPLRIIPTSTGKLPLDAKVLNVGNPTIIVVSAAAERLTLKRSLPSLQSRFSNAANNALTYLSLMRVLDRRGIKSMIVEGGSRLLHSLHEARLVTELLSNTFPSLLDHRKLRAICKLTSMAVNSNCRDGG